MERAFFAVRDFMKHSFVYILLCSDNSYYVGVTTDIQIRFIYHQQGNDARHYTFSRRPFKLVYYELHIDINDAIAREKQIKRWSMAKKEALIAGDIEELKRLSKGGRTSV